MSTTPEELSLLPEADEYVLESMHDAHTANPRDIDELVHTLVEDDQEFAFEILRQGYIRSGGDPDRQYGFIEGASFAREALRRTLALKQVEQPKADS